MCVSKEVSYTEVFIGALTGKFVMFVIIGINYEIYPQIYDVRVANIGCQRCVAQHISAPMTRISKH